MAKGRRTAKPYDASNSFVKKVATKVTDLIPQRSWISKWFNNSQDNGDMLEDTENQEELESEEDSPKPPPSKWPCIRMDVTYPPGTFSIQPRGKASAGKGDSAKQYAAREQTSEDFSEPPAAGTSGTARLISSTPAVERDVRGVAQPQRTELGNLNQAANNGTSNGMDDNSESSESTSGCSSLIPQTNRQEAPSNASYNFGFSSRKRFMDDKLNFANHLQSPRSLFLESNSRDSLSSRRPSFNASVMTNSMERGSPLSSPFYSGNITFGGANAAGLYKRSRSFYNNSNELQLKVPRRTNVEVKPSSEASVDSSGMSQTAKKILEALEHFSSPIADAKKIPLKSNSVAPSSGKKRPREEAPSPSPRVGLRHMTRELAVPTVPDILKLRRRQKLQDTTVVARRIVSARSEPPPASQEYRLGSDVDPFSKPLKLKAKAKANLDQLETVEQVPLPSIPLPITSLPNFNFAPPTEPKPSQKSVSGTDESFTFASPIKLLSASKILKSINNFTFSSPISSVGASTAPSASPPAPRSQVSQNFAWTGGSTAPRPKEKKKTESTTPSVSAELQSGSVLDFLRQSAKAEPPEARSSLEREKSEAKSSDGPPGASASSVWECAECLIKNSASESHCVACKAGRPSEGGDQASRASGPSSGAAESKSVPNDCFGSRFKLLTGQWECSACYVRNKQSDARCVSCDSPKTPAKDKEKESKADEGRKLPDLSKFNPPEGSWECPGCMLRNAASQSVCPCCNASKPNVLRSGPKKKEDAEVATATGASEASEGEKKDRGGAEGSKEDGEDLMAKFRPPKDSWECPCCMVRNGAAKDTCPLCNTPKPTSSASADKKSPKAPANGFGDKFKRPEGVWICDVCMLQNNTTAVECVVCGAAKPGLQKTEKSGSASDGGAKASKGGSTSGTGLQFNFGIPPEAAAFKFGIDKAEGAKEPSATTNGFKFGDKSSQPSVDAPVFTFGIRKEDEATKTPKTEDAATSSVKGESAAPAEEKKTKAEEEKVSAPLKEEEKKLQPAFSFGVPKETPSEVRSTSAAPTTGFSFGVPKEAPSSDSAKDKDSTTPSTTGETTSGSAEGQTQGAQAPTVSAEDSGKSKTPWFSFGVPQNPPSTSVAPATVPSAVQAPAVFSEAKPATQSSAAVPSFGQMASAGASGAFNPALTHHPSQIFPGIRPPPSLFGSGKSKAPSFAAEDSKTASFSAAAAKPSFGLPEAKVPAFGASEAKPSIFGATEVQAQKIPAFEAADKQAPVFGAPQAPVAPTAGTFGAPGANPPLFGSSAPPSFGISQATTFGSSAQGIFASAKAGETATPGFNFFAFGGGCAQPAPQATDPQKPMTIFGSGIAGAQSGNLFGGTNFGGGSSAAPGGATAAAGTGGFNFGAPKQEARAFGQPAETQSMFGAPQTGVLQQGSGFAAQETGGGFNFGFNAQPAGGGTGEFKFGEMSQPPPTSDAASAGFNFTPPSTTPTFDPNAPPSFNFTGGNTPITFNALPQQQSRRIKKAIRRTRDRPN